MASKNPFEQPAAPSPDDQKRPDLVQKTAEQYLKSGIAISREYAAGRAARHLPLLERTYKKEFGDYAEEMIEATLVEMLGPERVIDAPTDIDRAKPLPNENPAGKGQADFLLKLHSGGRSDLAVQMLAPPLKGREMPKPVRDRLVREKWLKTAEQGYITSEDGTPIPLTMIYPDGEAINRAFGEWQRSGRRGSPTQYLKPKDKEALTTQSLVQMRNVLLSRIVKPTYAHELRVRIAYEKAVESLTQTIQDFTERLAALQNQPKRKPGGRRLTTPAPPE